MPIPLAALARQAELEGDSPRAARLLGRLITEVTGQNVVALSINHDQYSLNSLNGFTELCTGERLFFKYHQEEHEEASAGEYYNARLLVDAGYRVDLPVYCSTEPGRQVLLYRRRTDPRLSDACRSVELGESTYSAAALIALQEQTDREVLEHMVAALHPAPSPDEVAAQPIHQLFWRRLVDGDGSEAQTLGGRASAYYAGQTFLFGQSELTWDEFARAHWTVNGVRLTRTFGEMLDLARTRLAPDRLLDCGVTTAHGDAHNANVWLVQGSARIKPADSTRWAPSGAATTVQATEVFFDPAFAGNAIPALLAEVKATFHNIFAHPFWLYEPEAAADRFDADLHYEHGEIRVTHTWAPSPLRLAFLRSKIDHLWRPLLAVLSDRGLLPADWEDIVRAALFCCPTLVRDLRANGSGGHTPTSSIIGFSTALAVGCRSVSGESLTDQAFTELRASLER